LIAAEHFFERERDFADVALALAAPAVSARRFALARAPSVKASSAARTCAPSAPPSAFELGDLPCPHRARVDPQNPDIVICVRFEPIHSDQCLGSAVDPRLCLGRGLFDSPFRNPASMAFAMPPAVSISSMWASAFAASAP